MIPDGPALATILFTDLVGSTALRTALGEEAADELRRRHDGLLTEAVLAHGGTVVKGSGDGILAAFGAASDALAAAVAAQQAVWRFNQLPDCPASLAIRVGVSAGDVSWENGDCFGTPVIEAARLEAAADGGEVLCADVVRVLAKGRGGHRFEPRGALRLKGLAEPLDASQVLWEPPQHSEDAPSLRFPAALGFDDRQFVSRDDQLALLASLLPDRSGPAALVRVVWLLGEPGIGKTRLAAEAARRAHRDGAIVLFGRCDEEQLVPFQPFVEALRGYCSQVVDKDLAVRLGPQAAHLSRLLPDLAQRHPDLEPPRDSSPELDKFRLTDAFRAWLARLTADRAVMLILDDVHWADASTLVLLRHLFYAAEPTRLLVIATARNNTPDASGDLGLLIDELDRTGRSTACVLDGLGADAVASLVEIRAPSLSGAERLSTVARLHARTSGHPLFLQALVDVVRERGDIDDELPSSVAAAVRARLARLDGAVVELLGLAALIGLEFDVPLLARAADRPESTVLDALELAGRAGVVSEVGIDRYQFAHALVRDVLLGQLTTSRRARLHGQIALAYERSQETGGGDYLGALAYHAAAAARDEQGLLRAVNAGVHAIHHAMAMLAPDEALELCDRTDSLLARMGKPPERARCEVLYLRGRALAITGKVLDALTTLSRASAAAHQSGFVDLASEATFEYGLRAWSAGAPAATTLTLLDALRHEVPASETVTQARLAAHRARALELAGDHTQALQQVAEAEALAARTDDPVALADARLAGLVVRGDEPDFRPTVLQSGLGFADDGLVGELHVHRLEALAAAARAALHQANHAGWASCCQALDRLAGEAREPYIADAMANFEFLRAFVDGDLDRARSAAERVAESTLQRVDTSGVYGLRMFLIQRERDELRPLVPLLRRIVADTAAERMWRPGLVALLAEVGETAVAEREYRSLAADRFAAVPADGMQEACLALMAEVALVLGDADGARTLLDLLQPWRHSIVLAGYYGGVLGAGARYLGLAALAAGDGALAEQYLSEALVFNRDHLQCPLWVAHSLIDVGHLLGDEALVEQARTITREGGYRRAERRCDEGPLQP